MSAKQIIVLVLLGIGNICVLSLGVALLLSNTVQPAAPTAQPVAMQPQATATVTFTPPPQSAFTTQAPSTPRPTDTRWATWTPRPSETSFPTITPSPTKTPTITLTPTRRPTNTPLPAAAPTQSSGGGAPGGVPGGGTGPGIPSNRIGCGTPNGRPTNGKLDVLWSIIAWRTSPADQDRAIGTIEVLPSGGNDCYKYNFMGRNYDYEPFEFEVPKCSSTPVELIVTSRDGQTWKQVLMIVADDPGFRCK